MSTDNQKLISFIEGRLRNDAMFLPVGEYNKYQRMTQEVALVALKENEAAPARYEFDEPALNIAQKIMECRATAAVDGWPDVRLKAAIQCLVIEAMKWAAPEQHHNGMMMMSQELAEVKRKLAECPAPNRAQVFIDGNLSGEAMDELLRQINKASPEVISIHPATAVPKGWKLVPAELTQEMAVAAAPYSDVKEYYRAILAAAPAPGGEHG